MSEAMNNELVKLLPCPFCGDEPMRLHTADAVWCNRNLCGGNNVMRAEVWNRRANAAALSRTEPVATKPPLLPAAVYQEVLRLTEGIQTSRTKYDAIDNLHAFARFVLSHAHPLAAGMPSEPTVAVPVGESRWLIERTYAKGYPAERREFWLGITDGCPTEDSFNGNTNIWTTNPIEAARFSSKAIAEKLRYRHFHPEAPIEACEHMFQCGVSS